uniref:uncharacterized protein LOC105349516 n=1 Tax=Fragaria vesca subsp. vesca TaxID=101020 RepID=UPI0005CA831D|nr:PREDICTED: uncharacterized protein LOC105349516 [Fragaria vesca subsp. vesca]
MVKEYSHLEFRCDLLKFGRLMTVEIRENVTELKLQLLDRTPFRSLFRAYYEQQVIESACRKSDIDIVAVLKCFVMGKNAFTFGEISGTISAGNIADIFGLNVEGREINLNQKKRKGDSEFIKRQFPGDKRLSKVILEKKIKDVAKLRGLENESDFVRLVCLYFCVTLFFCNSGNDLSWFIVPYIEDLESMSLYAWAPAVKNYLDTSLRGMNGWPESACGCLIALLFWFCERTRQTQFIPYQLAHKVAQQYTAYCEANPLSNQTSCNSPPIIKWYPPPESVNKLNFDGSVHNNSATTAGVVVRDSLGQSILAASKKLGVSNVLVVEAQALREGLLQLHHHHHFNSQALVIEGDSDFN